ncbi:MAG TPA: hypothetical protein VG755_01610 [Nannocystaceae bacterium]|nr:hypothetical protein [Nannocystaceae bacterium]
MIARTHAAALLLALGCVPPRTAEPPQPPQVESVATTPTIAPPAHAEPAPTQPPAKVPQPEQSVAPIDTGLGGDPIVGWPSDVVLSGQISPVLFREELAQLRHAVAVELARRKIATIPIAELERIEAAAAKGTLVLENDQRCVSPLSRDEVHARYFATNRQVAIDAACFDGCRLTVAIPGTPDDVYLTSRVVKQPEDPKRWSAAALTLTDELMGVGGLGLAGTSHAPPVRFGSPSWVGPWRTPPTDAQLSALDPKASACAHPDPMIGLVYALRATVDARGRVTRCDAESTAPFAREADAACLCGVLRELRFASGSSKRRVWVEAIDDGGTPFHSESLKLLQPGTEPWIDRLKASLALERCAASHAPPTHLDAIVSMQLAADGAVQDVRIDGDVRDAATMQWAQCVVTELHLVPLPCRPPGIDVLRARLAIAAP